MALSDQAKKNYRKRQNKNLVMGAGGIGGATGIAVGSITGKKKLGAAVGLATGATTAAAMKVGQKRTDKKAFRQMSARNRKSLQTRQANRSFCDDIFDIIEDRAFASDGGTNKRKELAGLVLSNRGGYRRWRRISSVGSGRLGAYATAAAMSGGGQGVRDAAKRIGGTTAGHFAAREITRKAPEGSGLRRSKMKLAQGIAKSAARGAVGYYAGDFAGRNAVRIVNAATNNKFKINEELGARIGRTVGLAESSIRGYESVTPKFKKKESKIKKAAQIIRNSEMDW